MKAGQTNNDASVVAQYYLHCVETIGGCFELTEEQKMLSYYSFSLHFAMPTKIPCQLLDVFDMDILLQTR